MLKARKPILARCLVRALLSVVFSSHVGCQWLLGDTGRELAADAALDGPVAACPDGMLPIRPPGNALFCIDQFEAARGPGLGAISRAGQLPWVNVTYSGAAAACAASQKRLCAAAELVFACNAMKHAYPYGDTYNPQACNGYDYGEGRAVPTGTMAGCQPSSGAIFDLSGNVAEWVADTGHNDNTLACDTANYVCGGMSGGSFASKPAELACGWSGLTEYLEVANAQVGFRCCTTP